MTGVGNGFFSRMQSFNNNVCVYTGRKCPSTWGELKANVSNNITICAKICTIFLDSSLGFAIAMSVVGVVTASVCAGEDVVPLISMILPFTTEGASTVFATNASLTNEIIAIEMVFLCFKDIMQNVSKIGHVGSDRSHMLSICHESVVGIDCGGIS